MFRRIAGFVLAAVMLAALFYAAPPAADAADMEDDNSAVSKAVASSAHVMILRQDKKKTVWEKQISGDEEWAIKAQGITDIAAGDSFFLAVKDGKVYQWNSGTEFPDEPIGDLTDVTKVFAGYDRCYAVTKSGVLYAWGGNDESYLGNGDMGESTIPVIISISGSVTSVAIGRAHTLAISGGKLFAWGSRTNGKLGLGSISSAVKTPTQVGSYSNVTSIAAGSEHSLAVIGGKVYAWGYAALGQLGGAGGVMTEALSPEIVPDSGDFINANIIKVAAGSIYSVAINNTSGSGVLYEWGNAAPGSSVPVENGDLSEVRDVFTNGLSFFAIARDALYMWTIGNDVTEIPWDVPDTVLGPGEGTTYKGICPEIYLSQEIIDFSKSEFVVKAYSINGGYSWVEYKTPYAAGKDPLKDTFNKLLDNRLTLWLANEYNRSLRPDPTAVEGVEYIKYDPLYKRASMPKEIKPAIMYGGYEDSESGDRTFVIANKVSYKEGKKTITELEALDDEYECTPQIIDGRKKYPDSESWKPVGECDAFEIPISKQEVKAYYVRVAPTEDTPGSKPVLIKPATYSKAPKYKVNYKTETLKIGVKSVYAIKGAEWDGSLEGIVWLDNHVEENDKGKSISIPIKVQGYIEAGGYILVRNPAKDNKKPGSEVQVIQIAERAVMENLVLECANGKAKLETKKYEVRNPTTGRWGAPPKITGSTELTIRLKPTAKISTVKATKGQLVGNAASEAGKLQITWGEYGKDSRGRPKEGITSATIIP